MLRSIVIVIYLGLSTTCYCQRSATYTNADFHLQEAITLFDQKLYGLAKVELAKSLDLHPEVTSEADQVLIKKATYLAAKASLYGKFPGGEKQMLDFYLSNKPDPLAYSALKDLGDEKFAQKRYPEALDFYNKLEPDLLAEKQKNEVLFKKGYMYFLGKDFSRAENHLKSILGKDTKYYFQSYYYMAMISFFNRNYENAIEYFFLLENRADYKARIPYYIAQIYFEQKKYDEILDYIPSQLQIAGVENTKELRHILGQTFFLLQEYEQALPHLEFYEKKSRKMRKEDFYQLAFTQYQLGMFKEAIPNFKELSNLENEMGQISSNYLGDAFLKLDQKEEARISFKKVTQYEGNQDLREEASYNYGKLSAELGYDRAAISSLITLAPSSLHYGGAQSVLGDLFESSKDYPMVIRTIEGLENKSPAILKAYQKVVLERGIQLIKDGDRKLALETLKRAARTPVDNYYSAVIFYHIADLEHQKRSYQSSIEYLNQYFTLAEMTSKLPDSASPGVANYLQGYNYLKTKNYTAALDHFKDCKSQIFDSSEALKSKQIYADASNRIADIFFTLNKYPEASQNYKAASELDFPGRDYALFQWAMINGLQGKPYEKIVVMENLVSSQPTSSFLDDAHFQVGETLLSLNQSREAEIAYEKILALNSPSPLKPRTLLKLGLIAYNQGETEKAVKRYTSLFGSNPSKLEIQEALLALEEIYVQDLGQTAEFVALVEEVTGYKMSNLERDSLSYEAAEVRFENGEYIEAIDSYTKYIDRFPKGVSRLKAIYNRAQSKVILNRYAEALPDYDLLISAGQSMYYEDAIQNAALIAYNDLQKFEEAFNYYSLLQDVSADEQITYEAQVGAMRSAYRFGNTKATLAYTSMVILNPLARKEHKGLAHYFAGKMHYKNKTYEASIANLEQVILLLDNEARYEARYLRNRILFVAEEVELAEEITLESISNSTTYPFWVAKNLLLYAEIMILQGDLFNARAAIEAVIENFRESEELQAEAKAQLILLGQAEESSSRIREEGRTINLDTIGGNE